MRSRASPPPRRSSRAGARRSRSGSRSRRASAAAAPTRQRRSAWPTRRSTSRCRLTASTSLAAGLGADVPFFLTAGPQLARGTGTELEQLDLPQDYWVVLLLPEGARKDSTASIYAAFDARGGENGYEERRAALEETLAQARRPRDLAGLPPNDLASSPHAEELTGLGAFRADVSGAGPVVYGLFHHREQAEEARRALRVRGRVWLTVPAWYG